MSRLVPVSFVLLVALLAPGAAVAHGGGEPFLHVPLDHITAGQSFPVIGADLGADASVSFRISKGDVVVPLGTVTAGHDGHFTTTRVLPATFPSGYAQLTASGSDGSNAETFIRVGERRRSAAAPTQPRERSGHPVAIVAALVVAGAGAALVLAAFAARRRRTARRPVTS